jgi:hypothetical protein
MIRSRSSATFHVFAKAEIIIFYLFKIVRTFSDKPARKRNSKRYASLPKSGKKYFLLSKLVAWQPRKKYLNCCSI